MQHKFLRVAYPLLTSVLLLSAVTAERTFTSTVPNLAGSSAMSSSTEPADELKLEPISVNISDTSVSDDTLQTSDNDAQTVNAPTDGGLIDEPHVYEIRPGMDEWAKYGSLTQKAEVCDVPLEELQQMTTRALYQTVLDYPLLINICAFNDLQTGIASVSEYFGGLSELFSRPDVLEVMREYEIAEDEEDADVKAILAECLQNYYEVMNLSKMSKGE